MRTLTATLLMLGLSLLGVCAPMRSASARDLGVARNGGAAKQVARARARRARDIAQPIVGADPATLPAAIDPAAVQAAVARGESAAKGTAVAVRGSGSIAGSAASSESEVDLDTSDDVQVDELCGEDPQCGTLHQIDLLPEVVFEKMEELPVVGMFVLPMTKGMTLDPGQGLPAVTFAVRPTKITRGSGLVAIAHF